MKSLVGMSDRLIKFSMLGQLIVEPCTGQFATWKVSKMIPLQRECFGVQRLFYLVQGTDDCIAGGFREPVSYGRDVFGC